MGMFYFIGFTIEHETEEFVTVGFGTLGQSSSTGTLGKEITDKRVETKTQKREVTRLEEKKVEVPLAQNVETNNVVTTKETKKEEVPEPQKIKPLKTDEEDAGRENTGEGEGNFGFEIDFGGKGKRKIYSYILPEYPEGVSKEIDVKLRFSILPDGTVGKIFPLIKADTRLEMAAIYSLRQWRFEPLNTRSKQIEQSAIIVFPYRLQ